MWTSIQKIKAHLRHPVFFSCKEVGGLFHVDGMWTSTSGEGGHAQVDASRWGTGAISMWTSIQKIRAHWRYPVFSCKEFSVYFMSAVCGRTQGGGGQWTMTSLPNALLLFHMLAW